jgi:hypothetical protein
MRKLAITIISAGLLAIGTSGVVAQDEEAAPEMEPQSWYTTTSFVQTGMMLPEMEMVDGVVQLRDGWLEFTSYHPDPRTAGVYRIDPINWDMDPATGMAWMWGTGHHEGETGGFEGPISGTIHPIEEGIDGFTATAWLTGTGEYEGLTYWYRGTFDGEYGQLEQLIYEGDPPPME